MTPKHLCILLLALVAASGVAAQTDNIPIENDNQNPLENPEESAIDVLEGSGYGTGEELPAAVGINETTPAPQIEDVNPTNVVLQPSIEEDQACPEPCVCHYEGGSENFVVDCSGYDLTEFPSPIAPKTTTLNIQNNKLTEIPKEVSLLKNLKVLNAENNQIMDLALGSVSELPELTVLKLARNKLIEYPKDLKNSLSLTKLEELDLGDNDIRGELKPETLSNFKALRVITLPTSTSTLPQQLCDSLKDTLSSVCTESCNTQLHECADMISKISEEGLFDAANVTLSNTIFFDHNNSDPDTNIKGLGDNSNTMETPQETLVVDTAQESSVSDTPQEALVVDTPQNNKEPSLNRNLGQQTNNAEEIVVNNQEAKQNMESRTIVNPEADVTVGATTTEGKNGGGGVNKSVIGIVVAAMVVIVAGITIKKNWSSIKRKFSSSPRPGSGANANGTTTLPEEVPLQDKDKSPV